MFRRLLKGLYVEERGINRVKELMVDSKNRLIFMPIFKSVVDNLLLLYILMAYNMEVPFVFANSDEIPNNKVLVDYSRKAGIVY
jgi:hypothetical protein